MNGIKVYFDYGFGRYGLGTYIVDAKTNKVLMFIKENQ